VVFCLDQGAVWPMLMLLLLLIVACFSKIHIGFTFLVPTHLGSPGKGPLNGRVCTYGLGSVLLWRRCDALCTSVFMDDVIFAHNVPAFIALKLIPQILAPGRSL